jgi:hypothetical protein
MHISPPGLQGDTGTVEAMTPCADLRALSKAISRR